MIAGSRPVELRLPFGFILSMSAFIGMLIDPGLILEFLSLGAVAAAVSTITCWWWCARNAVTATDEGIHRRHPVR